MTWEQSNLALSKDEFSQLVRQRGGELYRDLPWRNTRDPYEILLSEIMLQQTQVARVLTRWERFLGRFPTVDALAAASVSDVLEEWQGMGYNRRALALKRTADVCAQDYDATLPQGYDELIALPGVGPSTAAGVRAFAFDLPGVYLETNVRTVFLHVLFPGEEKVSDKVLKPLVEESCPTEDVRGWYYALLDFGAQLKREVTNPSRRSAHYTRQSTFEGSFRQKRAELVRCVLATPGISCEDARYELSQEEQAAGRDGIDSDTFEKLVSQLVSEGFFSCEDGHLIP